MCENPKVGSESVLEKPNQRQKVKTESRVSMHFVKQKTAMKQPQYFQCLFSDAVILMIKLYITDVYVYNSL